MNLTLKGNEGAEWEIFFCCWIITQALGWYKGPALNNTLKLIVSCLNFCICQKLENYSMWVLWWFVKFQDNQCLGIKLGRFCSCTIWAVFCSPLLKGNGTSARTCVGLCKQHADPCTYRPYIVWWALHNTTWYLQVDDADVLLEMGFSDCLL